MRERALNTRLRDLREDADLTQTQVAAVLHMSQTGYSKYETGENDIPTQVLIRLARFYGTSTDYLLGLSQRTYAYYESGQRMVPPEVLCALGDLYGVSVDYLLGRTDRREMNR